MISSVEQGKRRQDPGILDKVRSYNQIIDYLDALKEDEYSKEAVLRTKQLDKLVGSPSATIDTLLVGGTNGKSLTIHFAAKLLKEEGFKVGISYARHILTYNERMLIDAQPITNKSFTDCVNEVIDAAEKNKITATAFEILTVASFLHFKAEGVNVVLLEVGYGGALDATAFCTPLISAVTRIAHDQRGLLSDDLDQMSFQMLDIAKAGTWFISAEQSKLRLQKMKTYCQDRGIKWAMPIRKLAQLPYIYEQLYGRTASLGERIAQIYVEDVKGKFSPFLRGNLLATQKGQRGRPTLEAKRNAELNPLKTLKSFWSEHFDLLRCRFELLDKEKPSILLDNAANLDAFTNFALGIRLFHYQRPLKGLALIIGLAQPVDAMEILRLTRYLLKKVNGQIFFVTLPDASPSHDPAQLAAMTKELNIKAKACDSFQQAFEQAKASVDERDGLIGIAGSNKLIAEYWKLRGVKKL